MKTPKKLRHSSQTVRVLSADSLRSVRGAVHVPLFVVPPTLRQR
jgi:hypothetical protein